MSEHVCSWYCKPDEGIHAFPFLLRSDGDFDALRQIKQLFHSQKEPFDVLSVQLAREADKPAIKDLGHYIDGGVVKEWPVDYEKNHTAYIIMVKMHSEVKQIES